MLTGPSVDDVPERGDRFSGNSPPVFPDVLFIFILP
jgi:hypothetical protein